jgi:formate dehydrogenase major subunit
LSTDRVLGRRAAWQNEPSEEAPMKERYTRLTHPLVRDNGVLRRASWDEAMEKASTGFRRLTEAHGPKSFGVFSCSKATNEMNFLAQKLARQVLGSHNVDSCNRT